MHESERIGKFLPLMQSLYNTARENMGFEPHAKICIIKSDKNMANPLGKTAHYSPSEHKIALYTKGRHIKDILRSLAHELVHHNQNCRGDFDIAGETVQGYAQEDGHLREMEREAYECGNMIFRDWEDNLKKKGGVPLFTSTKQYVRPMMTDMVGGRLLEGDKMKNNLIESRLRDIIRGVIQEMFNDDLNEGDMIDGSEKAAAAAEEAEAAEIEASKPGGKKYEIEEGTTTDKFDQDVETKKGERKGLPKVGYKKGPVFEDSGKGEAWNDWKNEHADDNHIKEMKNHLRALEHDRDYERKDAEYDHDDYEDDRKDESKQKTLNEEDRDWKWGCAEARDQREYDECDEYWKTKQAGGQINEDSGEEEAWHDWLNEHSDDDHIKELEHHLRALKEDRDYERKGAEYDHDKYEDEGYDKADEAEEEEEEEEEELAESFFPKGRSVRQKARVELNEALMKRWFKIIK
jgi:hypothetical protein